MASPWAEQASQRSLFCSFCGKDSASVKAMIAGPTVFICNACVAVCNQCLGGESVPVQRTDWDQYPDEELVGLLARTAAIADGASEMLNSHVDAQRKRDVTWEAI